MVRIRLLLLVFFRQCTLGWWFLVPYHFVNYPKFCWVRPVLNFHVAVPFYVAMSRVLFYFVTCCFFFQFWEPFPSTCKAPRLTGVETPLPLGCNWDVAPGCISVYCAHNSLLPTWAPYVSRGRNASLYIVANASCIIPHVNFAEFDKLWISFALFSAAYVIWSWNLNLWSRINPNYFIWVICSRGLLLS